MHIVRAFLLTLQWIQKTLTGEEGPRKQHSPFGLSSSLNHGCKFLKKRKEKVVPVPCIGMNVSPLTRYWSCYPWCSMGRYASLVQILNIKSGWWVGGSCDAGATPTEGPNPKFLGGRIPGGSAIGEVEGAPGERYARELRQRGVVLCMCEAN